MKKIFIILISIMLCSGYSSMVSAQADTARGVDYPYAEYISEEEAPIIDGSANDAAWENVADICDIMNASNIVLATTAVKVKMLWNESGLYYFADVIDSTPNDSDICNFWISESIQEKPLHYAEVDGAYYLCISPPDGINNYYCISGWEDRYVDMSGNYTVAVQYTDLGYSIELYVKKMGTEDLALGNYVGVEISVDNYLEVGAQRDHYICWKGQYYYWEFPFGLGEVKLCDFNRFEASDNESNGNNTSSDNSLDISNEGYSSLGTGTSESNGCFGTVGMIPIVVMGGALFAFFAKKRKED